MGFFVLTTSMKVMNNIKNIMNQFPGAMRRQAVEPVEPEPSKVPSVERQLFKHVSVGLQSWKDSEAVTVLSKHLQTCEGIQLVSSDDGCLVLSFRPGLDPDNKQRWSKAVQALAMLEAAYNDLQELIKNKKLKLKTVSC